MTAAGLSGTVLVTWSGFDDADPALGGALREAGLDVRFAPRLAERSQEEVVELAHDAVAVVADADPFNAFVFERAPALKVVARVGVGTDSVDIEAATRAGIAVTTTPGLVEETVADHALALLLGVLRKLLPNDASVRRGEWDRLGEATPWGLNGSVVGVVGYGGIGRAVARRLRAFGVELLVHDPFVESLDDEGELVPLDDLLARSDAVTLHSPLTPGSERLIDRAAIAHMKPGAVLVNTARGPIVEEAALVEALQDGRLAGAGLDVFELEPPPSDALRGLPNVLLSPHIAGVSPRSVHAMTRRAVECVIGILGGEDVPWVLNPDYSRAAAAR